MSGDFGATTAAPLGATAASRAELAAVYHQKGWVKLPQLLDEDELATINANIAEAIERPEYAQKSTGNKYDQTSEDYQRVMRVYRALSDGYPEVDALVRRLGPLVGELNGWERTRLWQDRLFIKPGSDFGSKPTNWHQDVKLPLDRRGWCTVWIAMVDVPKSRGPMTFLNGSHRLGSLGNIEQLKHNYDLSELVGEHDWKVLDGCESGAPLAAGDATMHMMLTLHRAGENHDVEDRVILAVSYFDANQLYTGSPNVVTDNIGLKVFEPFEHENFPIVG
jgi:ectoine hydroxylase-related dioxygenase (phytanoyl-CoA dioxygenase family)